MKIDLTKLKVETDFNGHSTELNCAKEVSNYVKNHTSDIGLEDVCREIYHSDGEVEIPDAFIKPFIDIVLESDFRAAAKRAIRDILTKNNKEDKK